MAKTDKNQNFIISKHLGAKITPRKVLAVANYIRGKTVDDAMNFLEFNPLKASPLMMKIIKSAVSNAANNNKLSVDSKLAIIDRVEVGPGASYRMMRFAGRGRVRPLKKRSTNISVYLDINGDK